MEISVSQGEARAPGCSFPGLNETHAVALILEGPGDREGLPAALLTLVEAGGRPNQTHPRAVVNGEEVKLVRGEPPVTVPADGLAVMTKRGTVPVASGTARAACDCTIAAPISYRAAATAVKTEWSRGLTVETT